MKKARVFGVLALVCLCAAVVFLLDIPTYIKVWRGQVAQLSDVDFSELRKGDVVSGDAGMSFGYCSEEYTTNFGVRTSKDSNKRYYVLMLDTDLFMLYCTSSKEEYAKLDQMEDETIAYYDSVETYMQSEDYEDLAVPTTKVDIQGSIASIPWEVQGYYREWYTEYIGDDFDECCLPLMITHLDFDRFGVMLITGIVAAIGAVCFSILALVMRAKNKQAPPEWN